MACGGGSKGSVSFSSAPDPASGPPTIADARIVPFDDLEPAIARSANRAPSFTSESVTQSSIDASVSTAFDGSKISVMVSRESGRDAALDSTVHSVYETLDRSAKVPFPNPPGLPDGYDRHEDWTLFSYSSVGTSAIYVTVSWNHANPADFLANGYWMLLDGNLQSNSISNAEAGAFIDGSEFSSPPSALPASGTATFRGLASGMYTFYYGPGWRRFDPRLPGTKESGVYTGIATLTADFSNNNIEGCIGCTVAGLDPGIVVNETAGNIIFPFGLRHELEAIYHNAEFDGDLDQLDPNNRPSLARIKLGSAPIYRNTGTFATNANIVFEVDYFPGGTTTGQWGGRFSNRPVDGDPNTPRLVGGTTGVEWSHPEAGRYRSIGTFFAAPTP